MSDREWDDADGGRSQGDSLNAIGTAEYTGQRLGQDPGGNTLRGDIDQGLPTAIVARGQDVSSPDNYKRGVRSGTSNTRNEELYRGAERGNSRR
jgi:hypothetical protein